MKNIGFIVGIIFLSLLPVRVFTQTKTVSIQGLVTDTASIPLRAASIVLELNEPDHNVLFEKTDQSGRFQIAVAKNVSGTITASYLGFEKYSLPITIEDRDVELIFKLKGGVQLEEVVINYQYQPIVIKKDTIVFDAVSFTDGSERKLQDILTKLPGVTVRNGQVLFQGNVIMNTRVEDRPFFGGNTRLAIENIPSEAVSKIEMISHFSDIDFMKDVIASEDMAMNVTLKETHKNLFFGDAEASAGTSRSFNAHAALFSYKPESNMQFIGDWNNTGKALFSLSDFIQLQGGFKSLNRYNPISNSGLLGLTEANRNHKKINQQFAATSYQKVWKDKWDLSVFGIFSRVKSEEYSVNQINYLLLDRDQWENRDITVKPDNLMGWLNLRLDYKPSAFEVFNYRMGVHLGRQGGSTDYISRWTDNTSESRIENTTHPINVQSRLEWNKKINPKNTVESSLDLKLQRDPKKRKFETDDFYFGELLPLNNEDIYRFMQRRRQESIGGNYHFQYYYILNRFHQLSPIIDIYFNHSSIHDNYEYVDNEKKILELEEYGFGNNLTYHQFSLLGGLQYKFERRKIMAKFLPAFTYIDHNLHQLYGRSHDKEILFIPKINVDYKFTDISRAGLVYEYSFSYPTLRHIDGGYDLVSFNTLYRGLPELNIERFQTLSAHYRNFSIKKNNFWTYFYYTRKSRSYRSTALVDKHSQLLQSLISYTPESNLSLSFLLERTWKHLTPFIGLSGNMASYNQLINDEQIATDQIGGNGRVGIRVSEKNFPTIRLSYERSLNKFEGINNSTFHNDKFELEASYLLANTWSFKSNYYFFRTRNQQRTTKKDYTDFNTEIVYQPRGKPWSVMLEGQNILNNVSMTTTSQTNYLATDQSIATLPRQILLGVRYKL